MPDPVRDLYAGRRYPALSHPATHPSRVAMAARLGGLRRVAMPDACRVLELGCASGHNLLPLAERYPESRFLGVDFSDMAIRAARAAAEAAGLGNVRFETADLAEWMPDGRWDFIIAHGVFSWVADELKARLLDLCAAALDESGVACIGYNTLPGWSLRRDVAPLVRALTGNPAAAFMGGEPAKVAGRLAGLAGEGTPYAAHLRALCRDMEKKGPEVLPFDDLAPVCDPVYFGHFAAWVEARRLRYFGEADPAENLPAGLDPAALEELRPLTADPVLLQQTLDLLSGRTHRCSLLCRQEAPLDPGGTMDAVLDAAVVADRGELPAAEGPCLQAFRAAVAEALPLALPVHELTERAAAKAGPAWEAGRAAREIAAWLFQGLRLGWIGLRADEVRFDASPPASPRLSPLNLHFAGSGLPVVDAWHAARRFPEGHERLLAALDGTIGRKELEERAAREFPELDFPRWIAHLAERGIFV